MLAAGARFTLTRRDDGTQGFLWDLPAGADRARCRTLIREGKGRGATFWAEFVRAIIETAGKAPQ